MKTFKIGRKSALMVKEKCLETLQLKGKTT